MKFTGLDYRQELPIRSGHDGKQLQIKRFYNFRRGLFAEESERIGSGFNTICRILQPGQAYRQKPAPVRFPAGKAG